MTTSTWTRAELDKIENAEELQIASLRDDGTLRKAVTIWVVRVGDDLYVRSVNGRSGSWFRGMQMRHEGHVRADGVEKDVSFVEDSDPHLNEQVDAAYQAKYRRILQISSIAFLLPRREPRRSNSCHARVLMQRIHPTQNKRRRFLSAASI